jgi:hypothetical protein
MPHPWQDRAATALPSVIQSQTTQNGYRAPTAGHLRSILTGWSNAFAEDRALEEAYDAQIKTVKDATGVQLDNPMRGGYNAEAAARAKRTRQLREPDDGLSAPQYRAQQYQQKLAELRDKHPDLDVGDLNTMARNIAKGTEGEVSDADANANLGPVSKMAAGFAGGLWAGRRDPLFVGSLFAGPTSAVGKAALTRIVTSGLMQGAYNLRA